MNFLQRNRLNIRSKHVVKHLISSLLVSTLFLTPLISFATSAPEPQLIKKTKLKKSQHAKPKAAEIDPGHFDRWGEVQTFVDVMAARHGFDRQQMLKDFEQVALLKSAIQLVKPAPPGKPKNWKAYRARFVENGRIDAGIAFWDKYADALALAEQNYGVPAEIIVGLIGVETIYGRNTGSFRVIDALTTLAFAYPDTANRTARMDFFRSELENLYLLARETSIDIFSFRGSYAGAIGWSQFMPSSLRTFAVDFDHDGKIDLSASPIDAIGSVANYLALHGWKKGLPTAFPATLSKDELTNEQLNKFLGVGLKASFSLDQLKEVATTANTDAPTHLLYGLVNLQNGTEATEYWLATENFFAITQYNRSYFYAMSVIDLGKVVASGRNK